MAIFLNNLASKGFKENPTLKFEMVCLKGWLTVFFLGLIVFYGGAVKHVVNASFVKKTHYFSHNLLYSTSLCPFSDKRADHLLLL